MPVEDASTTIEDGSTTTGVDAGIMPTYHVSCMDYCNLIMQTCYPTASQGDNTEYLSTQICQSICSNFDTTSEAVGPGAPPASTETLNCRLWHANAAINDPHDECPRAGPLGGKVCDTNSDPCEPFCRLNVAFCTGDAAAYAGYQDCLNACEPDGGYPGFTYVISPHFDDTDLNFGYKGLNTLNCRLFHLENYLLTGDPVHCFHSSASGGGICVGYVDPADP